MQVRTLRLALYRPMNCLICNRPTRVISTQPFGVGGVKHTRRCTAPLTHTHPESVTTTYELPAAVLSAIGLPRVRTFLGTATRGVAARALARKRRATVTSMKAAGKRTAAIAAVLNVTEARVRQLAAAMP